MKSYPSEEIVEALNVIESTIYKCEKMHPKFVEGTSQHTLLKNRIHALVLSKSLLLQEDMKAQHTQEELQKALAPITSIINKCEKGQSKFEEGTTHYKRFEGILKAMYMAKEHLTEEIEKTHSSERGDDSEQ